MSTEDTQPLDPRELQDDPAPAPKPAPPAPTPPTPTQSEAKRGFDWSWFKVTGLTAAQHAAATFLSVSGGDALNLWHMDYKALLGASAGAALVEVLRAVVAYKLPSKSAT